MPDSRRLRIVDGVLFLLVLATAAGARVGYLISYADNATSDGPILVQDPSPELDLAPGSSMRDQTRITERDALARNIKEDSWFGSLAPFAGQEEQTAHVAPGYFWLLAEFDKWLPEGDFYLRWFHCLLGTLTAGLYYLIARRAFPSLLVATLAGLLSAIHPFWIVNTPAINDGVVATFLFAACLWLGMRGCQTEGALTSLFFGLALAALGLVRAAMFPFAVVGLLWFLRQSRRSPAGWQVALVAVLGFVIGLAPWALRNLQVFGDVFPIVDSTYYHLWIGNNPHATGGPLLEEDQRSALRLYSAEDLADPNLSQPARYRRLAWEIDEEIQNDPKAVLERRLWAGLYFFFGEDWFTHRQLWRSATAGPSMRAEDSPFPTLLVGSLLLMLLLGVLGWRWTYNWRRESRLLALAIMWVPLPYILSHADALSGPRLPLDGVLLCYSAFVLACLVPNVGKALLRSKRTL
jgi:4-amino-4-deoxy-L-arabinose transferase-like glycosyltransferase